MLRSRPTPQRTLVGSGQHGLSWSQGLAFLVTAAQRSLRQQEPAQPRGQRGAHSAGRRDEIPQWPLSFVAWSMDLPRSSWLTLVPFLWLEQRGLSARSTFSEHLPVRCGSVG